MGHKRSAKELLIQHNQEQYRAFTLNNDRKLILPEISSAWGIGVSDRNEVYRKKRSHKDSENHVKFITKNHKPHGFLWQTNTDKLKAAARWGIVKTHSVTGAVISTLGRYRILAHQRVGKGMVSNSQGIKLKLLDLYQSRFEALQGLESLVSKNNTEADYATAFQNYIRQLEELKGGFRTSFAEVDPSGLDDDTITQIEKDIEADIQRAMSYQEKLKQNKNNLRPFNRSRGQDSILEFVKEQMVQGLYELQGINQDITYSNQRFFALTRGELNDCIEDSRKLINEHLADPRNAVTSAHHGLYSDKKETLLTYDFADDHLSPSREREVLLAISFIEGWDVLDLSKGQPPKVSNAEYGEATLDTIAATRWKTHRNWKAAFKSFGYFLFNIIRGFVVSKKPWEEEAWDNEEFHLFATKLRDQARPNEPLLKKPFIFFKGIYHAIVDLAYGIRDFGSKLIIWMPREILNDWASRKISSSLDEVLSKAQREIDNIQTKETARLAEMFKKRGYQPNFAPSNKTSQLARVEYALTAGEQNDILTALSRGINEFINVFSHETYAKNPVAGLVFTAAYLAGVVAIAAPEYAKTILGSSYVEWSNSVAYSMASSEFAAAVGFASTQAQAFAATWDGVTHGPSGVIVETLYQVAEDPLTSAAYFMAAYGLGYVLANGVDGHPIPWISEHIKDDLGTAPETGYPIFGAKFAFALYEALAVRRREQYPLPELSDPSVAKDVSQDKKIVDRFRLAYWLSVNTATLPQLSYKQKYQISKQIDALFSREDRDSLYKLLYPETDPSIAFQLFSIPLSYIPAILRVGTSCVLSLFALAGKSPEPLAPAKRALTNLYDKTRKDLSRLLIFTTHLIYLPYTLVASFFKLIASLFTLSIGRVAGIFNLKPAHTIHQIFAKIHLLSRRVGEFFYPARVLKSVAVAHPTHTLRGVEGSYVALMKQMGQGDKNLGKSELPLEKEQEDVLSLARLFDYNPENSEATHASTLTA